MSWKQIWNLDPRLCSDSSFFRLIAPITLGMWIRYRWIKAAAVMDKIIVPFTLITVLFIFTVSHNIVGYAVKVRGYVSGKTRILLKGYQISKLSPFIQSLTLLQFSVHQDWLWVFQISGWRVHQPVHLQTNDGPDDRSRVRSGRRGIYFWRRIGMAVQVHRSSTNGVCFY